MPVPVILPTIPCLAAESCSTDRNIVMNIYHESPPARCG